MTKGMLMRHGVRFRGPSLTRRTRDALSRAGVVLIGREAVDDWNGQLVDYLVILDAWGEEDAIAKVRRIVTRDGSYDDFVPDP